MRQGKAAGEPPLARGHSSKGAEKSPADQQRRGMPEPQHSKCNGERTMEGSF